jgi:hypothetical protein
MKKNISLANSFGKWGSLWAVISSLMAVLLYLSTCTQNSQVNKNAFNRVHENGVETLELNGETVAIQFPKAANEQARQFVINLFKGGFDYTRIYETETNLEGLLQKSFGKLLGKTVKPVNNRFNPDQVDQLITYTFKGVNITYYTTAFGKKIFEELTVTGTPAIPLVHNIKIGMKVQDLVKKLGKPLNEQNTALYYGHLQDEGLYLEVKVTAKENRIAQIALRIAGGV